MNSKVCNKCNKNKSLNNYCKCSKNKDGLSYICKDCKKLVDKKYRETHKEKLSIQRKKYHEAHREDENSKAKKYNKKNKEKISKKKKSYREVHKEYIAIVLKQYYKENKENIKEYKKEYNMKNKEKLSQKRKKYYENNKDKIKEKALIWKKENRARVNSTCMKRIATKLQATPSWFGEFDEFVIQEAYITAKEREEKYGTKFQIDHIIPLQGKNVVGLHCGFNIQVITASENASKGNKILQNTQALWNTNFKQGIKDAS